MERVLVVEDSATQREMLRHTLAMHGFAVEVAVDGSDAWQRLAHLAPAVVLTDIVMPGMDGYQLCRAMKQDERFASIPVVLLTSLSEPKDVVAALECGADGFVAKPFAEDALLSRIRSILSEKSKLAPANEGEGFEINLQGRTYLITAGRRQIFDLLLSVYEVARRRNVELAEAQESLSRLNAELEQKVRDRTRKLEDSNKSLEAFCYSVAHDLRAPLRGIQGYMSALKDDYAAQLDQTGREYAQRASMAAGRMDKLILDLLAYGRVSHGSAPLEEFDVATEIEEVIAQRAGEIAASKARVQRTGQSVRIYSSRVLFEQIMHNLLGNALKFVRPGEAPHVTINLRPTSAGVAIAVEDRGIGIEPAYREKIFNLFEKVHSGSFAGTGIGLAIARKAADRINARISVNSDSGRGSTFMVEIPSIGRSP